MSNQLNRKVMKKHILFYCILAYSAFYSQANLLANENYSYTKTCLTEDCSKKIETVQYLDGLARPKQTISIKGSPLGKDVVQHIEYDAWGRVTKEYLPVPQQGTQNGLSYTDPLNNASNIYGSEKIYSEIIIENSPLSRIQKRYNVGTDWADKPINFDYSVNENEVIKFVTNTTWENGATKSIVSIDGSYPAHKLYKNKVTDEDGNETVEYKNDQGQIILSKKIVSTSESTDTYYVYNEYNQLVYVLSPLASKQIAQQTSGVVADNVLNKLSYQYKYDSKGRTVEKKVPGKEAEYFIYDQQDRMIMSQDTKQKNNNEWSFVKYDKLGRVLYTGTTQNSDSRQNIQAFINASQNQFNFENRTTSAFNTNSMDVYYTNTAFPTSIKKLLTINYYDTYPIGNPGRPSQVLAQNTLPDEAQADGLSTLGLPTASYINNIESDGWTRNYNWYDLKGRVISTYSYNYLGGYTKLESQLDFAGVAQKINTSHRRQASTPVVNVKERFVYSSQNVLLQRYHQVDSNPEELLAEYHYDEKGRMDNKKVGNNLQSVDFSYNIRGWMTGINKDVIDNLPASGKLFSYDIRHQNPESTSSLEFYNGTISEVSWNVSNTNIKRRYNYRYDKLSRLTDAIFSNPNDAVPLNHFNDEKVTYDSNGNILTLKRNAKNAVSLTPQVIDELQYNYDGNRLLSVNDNYNTTGYEGGGNTIGYDVNGNMTNMLDKNIQNIGYNFLNLANSYSITDNGTQTLQYTYRADGAKMSKVYSANNNDGSSQLSTTDYLDGFQYQLNDGSIGSMSMMSQTAYEPQSFTASVWNPIPTAELQFFPTAEGFYDYKTKQYLYQYKDHLGNVRVTYKNNAGIAQIVDQNDYYAFGMNMMGDKKSIFNTGSYYNYKFGQKELQENGFYDFGARMYMADLGRWNGIDPLAEEMRRHSPYNYAFNNPISFIDPDGMKAVAPQAPMEMLSPSKGMFSYYASGGRGDTASILAFLGLNDHLSSAVFDVGYGGGGGGGNPFGNNQPFGKTSAYRAIMQAWQSGSSVSLINKNGYFYYWTNTSDSSPDPLTLHREKINSGVDWYGPAGKGNWFFGTSAILTGFAGVVQSHHMYSQGIRRGIYGNYQLTGRNLSQFGKMAMTDTTTPISKIGKIGKIAGHFSFGLGVIFDMGGVATGKISVGKFILNTGMGALGNWGGSNGASIATVYFGVDNFYDDGKGNQGWPGFFYNANATQRELDEGFNQAGPVRINLFGAHEPK
jgi:RHS repeat-associated protein